MRDIKDMQLYPAADRILTEISARGFGDGPVPVEEVASLDQLHYHGVDAVDAAVSGLGISEGQRVLEVGSGWGGPSRWIAHKTKARVEAVEIQDDYDAVGRKLTERTGLRDHVTHHLGDFLDIELSGKYDHIVSWLALYHIPNRDQYLKRIQKLLKPSGQVWIEDLALAKDVPLGEIRTFTKAMFPNSIVPIKDYGADLEEAGFGRVEVTDMTGGWSAFVDERLKAFQAIKPDYIARHGADGFAALEAFYSTVAGYFADGILAGVRVRATGT